MSGIQILKVPRISDTDFRVNSDVLNLSVSEYLSLKHLKKFQYNWNILKNETIIINEELFLLISPKNLLNHSLKDTVKESIIGNFIPKQFNGKTVSSDTIYNDFINSDENKTISSYLLQKYENYLWSKVGEINRKIIGIQSSNQFFINRDDIFYNFFIIPDSKLNIKFTEISKEINNAFEIPEEDVFQIYSGKILFSDEIKYDLLSKFEDYLE